jgi:hypothetical protein
MATFGPSFANMAEAMLLDEENYKLGDSSGDLSTTEPIALPRSSAASLRKSSSSSSTAATAPATEMNSKRNYNDNDDDNNNNDFPRQQEQDGNIVVRPSPDRQNSRVSIQLPLKRQKIDGHVTAGGTNGAYTTALSGGRSSSVVAGTGIYSADDVVLQLQRAMSEKERQESVENAIDTFEHNDRVVHDSEIDAGADIALVKMLAFLEFKSGFRRHPIEADMEVITHEIGQTLKALECVYRSSTEKVASSFDRVGMDLLQMLVIYIDDEIKNRMMMNSSTQQQQQQQSENDEANNNYHNNPSITETDNSNDVQASAQGANHNNQSSPPVLSKTMGLKVDRDLMLLKATKILGHFARAGKASKPLCHFPGLLGGLILLLNLPIHDVPYEARLSCLWTIANVACNPSNMRMMMSTPNLINSLVAIGVRQPERTDSLETIMGVLRAKSIVSRAVLNLAWDAANKIFMAENVALVQMLSHLSLERQPMYPKSKTMRDIMTQTRRHSIGAIRHITAAPVRSKIALTRYGNGKLLDVMTDITLNETDSAALDLAYAAVHNLVIQDTAEDIVDRPALVLALKNAVLDDSADVADDTTDEVSTNKKSRKDLASSTIQVLEEAITPDMTSYETLRELLDVMETPTRLGGQQNHASQNVSTMLTSAP